MSVKKSAFTEGGQAICIGTVAVHGAYTMFPDLFWPLLRGMLPWICGLGLLTYLLFRLELE